jgi:hypothetical protein
LSGIFSSSDRVCDNFLRRYLHSSCSNPSIFQYFWFEFSFRNMILNQNINLSMGNLAQKASLPIKKWNIEYRACSTPP